MLHERPQQQKMQRFFGSSLQNRTKVTNIFQFDFDFIFKIHTIINMLQQNNVTTKIVMPQKLEEFSCTSWILDERLIVQNFKKYNVRLRLFV